jgi:hypothetical protein
LRHGTKGNEPGYGYSEKHNRKEKLHYHFLSSQPVFDEVYSAQHTAYRGRYSYRLDNFFHRFFRLCQRREYFLVAFRNPLQQRRYITIHSKS